MRLRNWGEKIAAFHIGGVAEQFDEVGLGYLVTRDEFGDIHGIEERGLTYALLRKVQDLSGRIRTLESIFGLAMLED